MALLKKAVDTGYRNAAAFGTEPALSPLRKREDFQKLLADLDRNSRANPQKSP